LESETVQQWIGRDIRHFRKIILEARTQFPKHTATQTAIDLALHDAFGKFLGIPVVDFYGRHHHSLPTSVTIGIKSVAETLEDARMYKDQGFKILKVKTGLELEEDIERCVKIRESFGNHFQVRVDANQGYDAQKTIAFYEATKDLGLELIEQPMPVGTESDMRALPEHIRQQIACDESLKSVRSAISLVQEPQVCGIFNIKLMKCGGLLGAFEIATVARAAGIDLFWGCFDESIISISAALHAAFACPHTRYIDLDGSFDLADYLVRGGFVLENGEMRPTDGPGFGFEVI
jgi:L-alanine-DL-glutamate epimerase-like enolase superfamily enzyme